MRTKQKEATESSVVRGVGVGVDSLPNFTVVRDFHESW